MDKALSDELSNMRSVLVKSAFAHLLLMIYYNVLKQRMPILSNLPKGVILFRHLSYAATSLESLYPNYSASNVLKQPILCNTLGSPSRQVLL